MVRPIAQNTLGLGIIHPSVVDTVFENYDNMMLICSKNQVDYDGGYVYSTKELSEHVFKLRTKYPDKNIWICRDHCGPGFKNYDIQDVYLTIETDIENGFDLLHIDFCHLNDKKDIREESAKAIKYALSLNPNIKFEVGTEDNELDGIPTEKELTEELKFFTDIAPIEYYVLKTNSLVKENYNLDSSTSEDWEGQLGSLCSIIHEFGVRVKEHNADYLNPARIYHRSYVDALNIAPELAYVINQRVFNPVFWSPNELRIAYDVIEKSDKWKKWDNGGLVGNTFLIPQIVGHYFQKQIKRYSTESCIDTLNVVIDRYVDNFIETKIIKPWGHERIFRRHDYLFKELFMKQGESCSLQLHNYKTETILVLNGTLKIETENSNCLLNSGQRLTIPANTTHRMSALTDTYYLEASTPHMNDTIRLDDKYGRL